MSKKTRKDVYALAKELGARIIEDKAGNSHSIEMFAPKGMIWSASFTHTLVDSSYKPWQPDWNDAYNRMSYGVERCEDEHCDWCNEEESDIWD